MTTVTDLFCGAGGSSIGLVGAGLELRLAANHWARAIETHAANFPGADHMCADISQVDPRRVPSTEILWASPECTHHSQARTKRHVPDLFDPAGDPAAERSRATMWDVPRFAERHRYRVVLVENVVEVTKWVMWPAWVQAMQLLGYEVRVVSLNSMVAWSGRDAAPQSRDRVYVVCWRGTHAPNLDFRPPVWCPKCERRGEGVQSWKNGRVVGKYRAQYVYRCSSCAGEAWPLVLPAAAAIDWTIPCPRIGERARPLADATMRRIRAGLERFGPAAIVQGAGHTFERRPGVRTWPITAPLPTQMTSALHGIVVDTAFGGDDRARSTALPFPTQTGRHTLALVEPFIAELRGGASDTRAVSEPVCTVTASGNHHGLVVGPDRAFVSKLYGDGTDPSMSLLPSDPLGTLTTTGQQALVAVPFLTDYHGNGRATSVAAPVGTVDCRDRHGLVDPRIELDDCGFRMLEPAEIGRAQAFPDTYRVAGSKRDVVRQYGNAVSPPAAALLAERVLEVLR